MTTRAATLYLLITGVVYAVLLAEVDVMLTGIVYAVLLAHTSVRDGSGGWMTCCSAACLS
ncbi:hypothetical protein [Nocardia sp. CA-135398]|uniref:hypothetical protein n=1 Tax=Nocardia sp. CA-135398 TaxID=3239977 RepID=UPI003D982FE2